MMPASRIYVGVLTARLEMPWVRSLKQKRAIVVPVVEKVKSRFPVSISRLDGLNVHGWELIGAAAISHDAQWLESVLESVADFVAANGSFRVVNTAVEIDVWDVDR